MDRLLGMEAFVRVVDAGSFSAAARQWGRSKAVLSKYVSTLEEHLGVELLRRTTRSLSLTEAGQTYHPRCVDVLAEIEGLEASVRNDHTAPRGTLRVTAPPGFSSRYLPLMTTEFLARHPGITLDLDLTHRLVDLVEEGIDVAIRLTEPRDSTMVARRLAPAPVVAVASSDYLTRRGHPEHPTDLRGHDCLVDTNFRDHHRWRFVVNGHAQTVVVRGPVRANNPQIVRQLALAGHGIALIPRLVVDEDLRAGTLTLLLPGMVDLHWSIYAVYPRRRYVSGRVRAFIDHLAEGLANGPERGATAAQ